MSDNRRDRRDFLKGAGAAAAVSTLPLSMVKLAFADPALTARVLAGPLPAITPETITDPDTIRARLTQIRATGLAEVVGAMSGVVPLGSAMMQFTSTDSNPLPTLSSSSERVQLMAIDDKALGVLGSGSEVARLAQLASDDNPIGPAARASR